MEQFADGLVSLGELPRFGFGSDHFSQVIKWLKSGNAYSAVCKVLEELDLVGMPFAAHLRDIFGNPFRPVTADPSWLTTTVVTLATGIYADRAFDRLPILADALQDTGCDNADVLDHCRAPGPHVRGCWVIDLLLSKS
jgi:hypothetical protein